MIQSQKLDNSRILITGGAGFIGSNLCEELLKYNCEVICFDNFSTGKMENILPFFDKKNFRLIVGDIRNYDDCL
ncbi:GDP-mannose 4,6-dehydratase, partial [Dysgonomonas sp.]